LEWIWASSGAFFERKSGVQTIGISRRYWDQCDFSGVVNQLECTYWVSILYDFLRCIFNAFGINIIDGRFGAHIADWANGNSNTGVNPRKLNLALVNCAGSYISGVI
jgi:hypothetical protein